MKTIEIKLFKYEELGGKARKAAIKDCAPIVGALTSECVDCDYMNTLAAFERIMNVRIVDRYRIRLLTNFEDTPTGKCLWRYIEYNIMPYLMEKKTYYINGKKRKSRIIYSDPMESCPLTGVYTDSSVLEPILKFRDGYWRDKKRYKDYDLYDLIKECVDNLYLERDEAVDYCYSEDGVKNEILSWDETFYEDGRRCVL